MFYLNLHFRAGRFGTQFGSAGGLTGSEIVAGQSYTAYGIVTVGHPRWTLAPCTTVATQGAYGGVLSGLGSMFAGRTVPCAGYGVIEFIPALDYRQQCLEGVECTSLAARTVFKIAEVAARRLVGSIPTRSRQILSTKRDTTRRRRDDAGGFPKYWSVTPPRGHFDRNRFHGRSALGILPDIDAGVIRNGGRENVVVENPVSSNALHL